MYRVYRNQAAAAAYSSLYFSFFFLSNFQTLTFFITLFLGTVRPRRLKLVTHVDNGWMYSIVYTETMLLLFFVPLFFIIFLSNFRALNTFLSHFSQELWGLKDWNLVQTWTVGRCIVYTGIRLLLLIYPFTLSFFFRSNFQALKCFVTLFVGTVMPRRLEFGTHMDSRQMYRVYRNQAAAAFSSFFTFLSLQFSNIKMFRHTFLRNCVA